MDIEQYYPGVTKTWDIGSRYIVFNDELVDIWIHDDGQWFSVSDENFPSVDIPEYFIKFVKNDPY